MQYNLSLVAEDLAGVVTQTIPCGEIQKIKNHYSKFTESSALKFLNPEAQVRQKLLWAVDYLNLYSPVCQPKKCFDIGCGAGFFSYVLRSMGHIVEMSDVGDGLASEIYSKCMETLGLERAFRFAVFKRAPLPIPNSNRYDLISATGVAFHENWNALDWEFFIEDALMFLRELGRLFLHVNDTGKAEKGFNGLKTYTAFSSYKFEWKDRWSVIIYK